MASDNAGRAETVFKKARQARLEELMFRSLAERFEKQIECALEGHLRSDGETAFLEIADKRRLCQKCQFIAVRSAEG